MSTGNHGAGGSYVIDDDKGRTLVERTTEQHEANQSPVEAATPEAGEALLPEAAEAQTQARSKKVSN
jgi:hypothetical protein